MAPPCYDGDLEPDEGDYVPPEVDGENVMLKHTCPLSFFPPSNTSLVRILGPLGENSAWNKPTVPSYEGGSLSPSCTYDINPWPKGINNLEDDGFLKTDQELTQNITNFTLHLVPLDPTVQYRLDVLPAFSFSSCIVSGFRTYSFY